MNIALTSLVLLIFALWIQQRTDSHHLCFDSNYNLIAKDTITKPTVLLEQTITKSVPILFIRDTSAMSSLNSVFGKDYGEIFAFISQAGLRPGKTMAFYLNHSDPIALDVAVEVDRLPAQSTGRIQARQLESGQAVVAHYQGPYENMKLPYEAIQKWLDSNSRQAKGFPFEVYLNEPMTVTDRNELKTDIFQMIY